MLSGTVTRATFAGPPVLVVGVGLTGGDERWALAQGLAASFSCPLLGIGDAADLAAITVALRPLRKFWSSDGIAPPGFPVESATVYPEFMGPIVHAPASSSGAETTLARDVWAWAASAARCSAHHKYGFGMFAVSSASPLLSPPIYRMPVGATTVTWAELAKLWRSAPPTTPAQLGALAALEVARPGASRHFHPSLLDWLYTSQP